MARPKNLDFPIANVRRIILAKAERKMRVNPKAIEEMIKILDEVGMEIAKESAAIAHSSPCFHGSTKSPFSTPCVSFQRKFIMPEDVVVAAQRVLNQRDSQ